MMDVPDFSPPLAASKGRCRYYSHTPPTPTDFGGPVCARCVDLSAPGAWRKCSTWERDQPIPACPLREDYTAEEIAAYEAWSETQFARCAEIMAAIPRTGKGTSGEMDCPGCKVGKVRYAFSSCNGHLHAACTTPYCFAVMQ